MPSLALLPLKSGLNLWEKRWHSSVSKILESKDRQGYTVFVRGVDLRFFQAISFMAF